ncbi:DUF1257 domain-containing protein [Calothrix sp. FACHB-1219]|uniref:DUF1257 domain-containing protein n=1 Tax=unclassified Calothrix TaxID=2619626 RepID=UPI0016866D65|nr:MULTISPECIES: DUF1257 domain-containing protein [unclassified Calothrix]MBD2201646.1 DUF1257 domain-containing protein [Calothrix sp. FACHB-168]MBD2217332.1 DUF1257 domain-containing protein [Calothrix sp. FACHB-1219]
MSHFHAVITQLKNKERLIKACEKVGAGPVISQDGLIRGYNGQVRPADIVLNIVDSIYDMGFDWVPEEGVYQVVGDWSGLANSCRALSNGEREGNSLEQIFNRICQIYAQLGIEEATVGGKVGSSANVSINVG